RSGSPSRSCRSFFASFHRWRRTPRQTSAIPTTESPFSDWSSTLQWSAASSCCSTSSSRPLCTRICRVFTVEQRDVLRDRVLRLAEEDERAVAGAAVGSLAVDGGDRFSDLDLTFGIADHAAVADVLDDWTRTLVGELDAVHLVDLERSPTIYRVF